MTTQIQNDLANNPLLYFAGLPKFKDVKAEHVTPAIDFLINDARATIENLVKLQDVTWDNFVAKLEDMEEKSSRAWSQVGHMNAVVNSPELREAYNDNLAKLTDFYGDLGQDERLYAKFKALRQSSVFNTLTQSQQKVIENELRDFKLGGAELPAEQKARFKAIQEELSKLTSTFEENVLDNTNEYALYVEDKSTLSGIPEDVLQSAQDGAKADNKSGYKFTLQFPSYIPVLQYADNRELRETLYRAYATRASEFGKVLENGEIQWDNTPIIAKILSLRHESAKMLGFANYAELSVATKMAKSANEVKQFLQDLAVKAKPFALKDKQELEAYAQKLGITDMQAWDVAYVSEKLREDKYAFQT